MKQEQKSLITKTKILDTAARLFAEKGYDETTMQDILTQSGLSKGAVYHHFESKNEILEYTMASALQRITHYLENLASTPQLSATERLGALIDFSLNNDAMNSLSRANWAEKIPYGLLYTLRNTVNVLARHIEKIILQGNESGEFNCPFPFETASVLLLLVDIWLDPLIAHHSFAETAKKIDYIAHFLHASCVPILSAEKCEQIKQSMKSLY